MFKEAVNILEDFPGIFKQFLVPSKAPTCGTERVSNGSRSSPVVELLHGRSTRLLATQVVLSEVVTVHGFKVSKDLASEGLVVFEHVDIRHFKTGNVKNLKRAQVGYCSWCHKWISNVCGCYLCMCYIVQAELWSTFLTSLYKINLHQYCFCVIALSEYRLSNLHYVDVHMRLILSRMYRQ